MEPPPDLVESLNTAQDSEGKRENSIGEDAYIRSLSTLNLGNDDGTASNVHELGASTLRYEADNGVLQTDTSKQSRKFPGKIFHGKRPQAQWWTSELTLGELHQGKRRRWQHLISKQERDKEVEREANERLSDDEPERKRVLKWIKEPGSIFDGLFDENDANKQKEHVVRDAVSDTETNYLKDGKERLAADAVGNLIQQPKSNPSIDHGNATESKDEPSHGDEDSTSNSSGNFKTGNTPPAQETIAATHSPDTNQQDQQRWQDLTAKLQRVKRTNEEIAQLQKQMEIQG